MTARPRGICPVCRHEYRVKADGTMGSHRRLAANGYSRGVTCQGVDQEPAKLVST